MSSLTERSLHEVVFQLVDRDEEEVQEEQVVSLEKRLSESLAW